MKQSKKEYLKKSLKDFKLKQIKISSKISGGGDVRISARDTL